MNLKYIIPALLLLYSLQVSGQKVIKVKYKSQADISVFIVDYESQVGWKTQEKQHLLL